MSDKPRRIDFSPDNLLGGLTGQALDLEEFGVYWIVCTLIYSHGGPIKNDPEWIARIFKKCNPRTVRAALDRLEAKEKIERTGSELMVNRCRVEIESALNRIRSAREHGSKGGRPSKENKALEKGLGLNDKSSRVAPSPSIPKKEDSAKAGDDAKREIFSFGRAVLGKGAGGLITKLITRCDGDLIEARALIATAQTKHLPIDYANGILRTPKQEFDDLGLPVTRYNPHDDPIYDGVEM